MTSIRPVQHLTQMLGFAQCLKGAAMFEPARLRQSEDFIDGQLAWLNGTGLPNNCAGANGWYRERDDDVWLQAALWACARSKKHD